MTQPTETDERHLRRAIEISDNAVERGSRPFGAVVVDAQGRVVAEAGAVETTNPRDWTAHSEMQALRAASAQIGWDDLGGCTLYASGEPCTMCASALFWCNIQRLVYSVSEPLMRALRRPYERASGIEMGCREIFDRCPRAIEVIGPVLESEGAAPHRRFWPNAASDV